MRIVFYICMILSLSLIACGFYASSLKKEIKILQAEKNGLKTELKRRQEVKENVQEREKIVEKSVYKDKKIFDWKFDIADTVVVNKLRLQCKSCSASAD